VYYHNHYVIRIEYNKTTLS